MFRNNLKYYPNKPEIFFNHSKHYEVFNTIYWKLFMFPNKSACSGTLWNVPKESPQCFRTFSKCSNVPVQFWNVSPNISAIFYNHIWNILKQSEIFLNKPKNIFHISKYYKVFNTIYWVLFMQTLTACSAELKWLGWR